MTEEIQRIQRAIRSGMIVHTKLAKLARVHRNTVRRATLASWAPSATTVDKLIRALNEAGV